MNPNLERNIADHLVRRGKKNSPINPDTNSGSAAGIGTTDATPENLKLVEFDAVLASRKLLDKA